MAIPRRVSPNTKGSISFKVRDNLRLLVSVDLHLGSFKLATGLHKLVLPTTEIALAFLKTPPVGTAPQN